jgi:hypothetical protein
MTFTSHALWIAMLGIAAPAAAEPLILDNGRLFVAAEVNGVQSEALLDSAAEASLVDPVFAARARLPQGTPVTIRGSGGTATATFVEGVTIRAAGVTLKPEGVVLTDLSELSARLIKRPTSIVLGRELFDAARLEIDIKGRQLQVITASAAPRGRPLRLTAHAGVEAIPVMVGKAPAQAEFDLGNGSGVLISRQFARKLGLRSIGTKAGGGIGGEVKRDLVRLPTLTLAGVKFRNIVAAIDDQPGANDVNVGTSILQHFLITTDFKQRAVWLHPTGSR